jgi:CelD/BcsL family acetyltransferase involved in cellulose biosynthesis
VKLRVARFDGLEGLRGAVPAWRQIMAASRIDPLCNGPDWCVSYAECFSTPETIFGFVLHNSAGAPVAILAFHIEPSRGFGTLRRARWISDGTFDSDYLDFPSRDIAPAIVAEAALDLLSRETRVQAAVLGCVPRDSETYHSLQTQLSARRLPRREHPVLCYSMDLPGSFDEYLKSLKPRVRSKVRQSIRIAGELGATFAWCDVDAELDRHLEGLYELHAMRWAAAGQAGCFVDTRRRRFFERVARQFLSRGALRFARFDIAGRPVAYQIGLLSGRAYYQLQEGYHTDFTDQRIGTSLRAVMTQRLIEEGVRAYDFMAGQSQHKTEWGGRARECSTVAFALPRLRARISYGARAAVDRWRARRAAESAAQPPAESGEQPGSASPQQSND